MKSLQDAECPVTQFDKDTSLIASHLHRIQMDFEGGIAVLGPPEPFQEYVKLTALDDGRTRVEIEDKVKKVKSKR